MQVMRPVGRQAAARKYDLLSAMMAHAFAGDPHLDVPAGQRLPAAAVVLRLIGVQFGRSRARSAPGTADRRDDIDQRLEHHGVMAIGTTQADGAAAAFLGGAVVGGWIDGTRSGFAGICTTDATNVQLRTHARSTRGAAGAADLRLRVLEGQTGAELYDSAD